jgi:RNA polymerase sigma-70 factor (ECF subfamily)
MKSHAANLNSDVETASFELPTYDPSISTPIERFSDWSDEQLLLGYRAQHDRVLFEELVRRYERELLIFLRRFLGDKQLAEDTFQATFLAVHLRMDQFQSGRRVKPWLYAIASNKGIDLQRRLKRHRIPSLDAPISQRHGNGESRSQLLEGNSSTPDETAEDAERCEQVRNVISQLNPATQKLMNLVYFKSMKYADISTELGIPVGTVKSRVHTAMSKLREIWLRTYPRDELSDRLR